MASPTSYFDTIKTSFVDGYNFAYNKAQEQLSTVSNTARNQVQNHTNSLAKIIPVALPAIAFVTAVFAPAYVTVGFVAATLVVSHRPQLISKKVAGFVLMAAGAGHFTANIAIPFSRIVRDVAVSVVLVGTGFILGKPSFFGNNQGCSKLA